MTQSINQELNQAHAQLKALQDSYTMLHGLRSLVTGDIKAGDKSKIDIVAKAIRDNYSIPLEYTQSYASLKALFEYAYEKGDTQLAWWAERQISQFLGPSYVFHFKKDLKTTKKMPGFLKSNREIFLSTYKEMTINDLQELSFKERGTFWNKQLNRITQVNKLREEIKKNVMKTQPVPKEQIQLLPFAETLKVAFDVEQLTKTSTMMNPQKIIKEFKVSPYVYVACLVESHMSRMNWTPIFSNAAMKSGIIFKGLVLPRDVLEKIFKMNQVPEDAIREYLNKK